MTRGCGLLCAGVVAAVVAGSCAGDDGVVRAAGEDGHFGHTETTTAPATAVFARWVDPTGWPQWDDQVESASIRGGIFAVGARGVLVPKGGGPADFVVVAVEPGRRAVFATALPGGSLIVDRSLTEVDGVTRFTHDVRFEGVSAPLFSWVLGGGYRAALPRVMQRLARLAEADVDGAAAAPDVGAGAATDDRAPDPPKQE